MAVPEGPVARVLGIEENVGLDDAPAKGRVGGGKGVAVLHGLDDYSAVIAALIDLPLAPQLRGTSPQQISSYGFRDVTVFCNSNSLRLQAFGCGARPHSPKREKVRRGPRLTTSRLGTIDFARQRGNPAG